MQLRFIKRIRVVPLSIAVVSILGIVFYFFAGNSLTLHKQTFKGTTAMKSLVVLNLDVEDELISGYGYHVYSSGFENYITISGYMQDGSNQFTLFEKHAASGKPYGTIRGSFSEDLQYVSAEWVNKNGLDPTALRLIAVEELPETIVEREGPKTFEKKAAQTGRKAKQAVIGFFKGVFSD